jgi:hypothetical protein
VPRSDSSPGDCWRNSSLRLRETSLLVLLTVVPWAIVFNSGTAVGGGVMVSVAANGVAAGAVSMR